MSAQGWSHLPRTVDLWIVNLDAIGLINREMLSVDERERSAAFKFEVDRHRSAAARIWLRTVLAGYAGQQPSEIRFSYNVNGKPSLADPRVNFNLSHSGGLAALAVCTGMQIGIDIEAPRDFEDSPSYWFFSDKENAALQTLASNEREAGFYRCWTRKEALVKADGQGLTLPLGDFDVSLDRDDRAELLAWKGDPQAASRWTLLPFMPANGVYGAIAVRSCGAIISVRRRSRPVAASDQAVKRASMM